MKQLRLVAQNQYSAGEFEWQLNDPIKLEPGAQVALDQCSLSIDAAIVVSDSNNTFAFRSSGATATGSVERIVTLNTGVYTANRLAREVERAMNHVLGLDCPTDIGFQWGAKVDPDKMLEISFDRNDPDQFPAIVSQGGTWAAPTLTKTDVDTGFTCWSVSTKPFIAGCGRYALQNATVSNACVGLSTTTSLPDGDPSHFALSIFVDPTTTTYWVSNGTIATDTTVAAAGGDSYGIALGGGVLYAYSQATTGPVQNYMAMNYDYEQTYYPVVSIAGAAGSTARVQYHDIDPFALTPASGIDAKPATKVTIYFNRPAFFQTADLLGFGKSEYSKQKATDSFLATNELGKTLPGLSLVILLDSIPTLHSYDSTTGGRRPIIATLGIWQRGFSNEVEYQPNYPVFLDVGNEQTLYLSTFKIRIVDAGNVPLAVDEGVFFSLLFK